MVWIVLRKTENWDTISLDKISFYTDVERNKRLIKMWNNRFPVDYFEYRYKIKNIALDQWPIPYVSPDCISKMGPEDWILPTDDDDWFHPDLPEFLESKTEDFVVWDTIVNKTSGGYGIHKWYDCHEMPCSNGYAFRKKLYSYEILHNHATCLKVAQSNNAKIGLYKDKILSCYNSNPGSLSRIMHVMNMYGLIKGVAPCYDPVAHPSWLDPHYGYFVEVVESLRKNGQ